MARYLLKKVLAASLLLFGVATIVFFAMRLVPGDPAQSALGEYATAEAIEALRKQMGITRPLWIQYVEFLGGLVRGDLGMSYITRRPVLPDLLAELPYTVDLMVASTLVSVTIGIPIGILAAVRQNSVVDYLMRAIALVGLSVPPFYLGILLLVGFALKLPLFPIMGGGNLADLGNRLHHLALPAFGLGLSASSFVVRMTRAALLDVLREDYVRTAQAKGLPPRIVLWKHALRNALIPVVTVVGLYMGLTLGGAVLTETVFNRPGLGRFMVGAILKRDYIVIQSSMVLFASFVLLTNLLIDLTYTFIDPKIKYR